MEFTVYTGKSQLPRFLDISQEELEYEWDGPVSAPKQTRSQLRTKLYLWRVGAALNAWTLRQQGVKSHKYPASMLSIL